MPPWAPTPPPPAPWPPAVEKVLLAAWGLGMTPQGNDSTTPGNGTLPPVNTTGADYLYYLVQTDVPPPVLTSWAQCRADCERLVPGGGMLSYGSAEEQEAVTRAVLAWRAAKGPGPYPPEVQALLYLGATDGWEWLDDTPWNVTDWFKNQPGSSWEYDDQPHLTLLTNNKICAAQGVAPDAFPWLHWADYGCDELPGPYVRDTVCVCKLALAPPKPPKPPRAPPSPIGQGCYIRHFTFYGSFAPEVETRLDVPSAEACCTACGDVARCMFWTFSPGNGVCFLLEEQVGS
ncbi:hypothetical protein HYH03_015706 [Edaphochlamys debaryana]|uniref:C-type lectin domain-containing protein n=1 Tax=Edaphochlamys debaryana TaxID=47281 RepID=A0A835XKJ8_9CHLO|nr:hypothetical protein HYH03_015706 [Edaphochlamys debaryana]|eukprot:KAG2485536.1 hypothetical protein HYH03_015706 [Edaphochlamys debaryana]